MAIVYNRHDGFVKAPRSSIRRRFDPVDVVVGEAEMVADFMDEDVFDDRLERLLALAPEIEQGPAIQENQVGRVA